MSSRAFAQGSPGGEDYRSVVAEAVAEFNQGNFSEARTLFERAHDAEPNARTLRGLGLCAFELRHYVQAVAELEAALTETRTPLTADQRADVTNTLVRAKRYVGKVAIETTPPDANVAIDGRAVDAREVSLDVGDHSIVASAPAHAPSSERITIVGGQLVHTRLTLQPLAPDVHAPAGALAADSGETPSLLGRWWFWGAVGVAVAALGVGTALALAHPSSQTAEPYAGSTNVKLMPR